MARVLGILRGLKRGQHTNKHKKIKNLGLTNRKNVLFHRNLFVSNGSNGLHRNDFLPPHPTPSGIFLSLSRIEEMNFSIGIYSCPMDHLHFTTTLPVFRWKVRGYDWSLVNGYWTPSESSKKKKLSRKLENDP